MVVLIGVLIQVAVLMVAPHRPLIMVGCMWDLVIPSYIVWMNPQAVRSGPFRPVPVP